MAAVRCGLAFSSLIFWPALCTGEPLSNVFPLRTFRLSAIAGARDCRHLMFAGVSVATPSCFTASAVCLDDLTPLLDDATPDAPFLQV